LVDFSFKTTLASVSTNRLGKKRIIRDVSEIEVLQIQASMPWSKSKTVNFN